MNTFTSADLMTMKFPPQRFAVEGLLAEGLAMLAGDPKIGKSWFSLQLAQSVSSGEPILGHETNQGDVLYLAYEDGQRRLQSRITKQRLGAAGASRLAFSINAGDINALHGDIRDWHAASDGPRLVIIDTYGRADVPITGRNSEYAHTTAILGPLQALAIELGITIFLVHHTNKAPQEATGSNPFRRILGSQGIAGAADTLMVLSREGPEGHARLEVVARDNPEMTIPMRLNDKRCIWERVDAAPDPWPGESGKRRAILNAITKMGGSGPLGDIRGAVDGDTVTNAVSNTLTKLVGSWLVVRPRQGFYALAHLAGATAPDEVAPELSEVSEDGEPDPPYEFDLDDPPFQF